MKSRIRLWLFSVILCSCFNECAWSVQSLNLATSYDSVKVVALMDSAIANLYTDYQASDIFMDSSLAIAQSSNRVEDEYWILQWRLTSERYWLKFDHFFDTYNRMKELNELRAFSSSLAKLTWLCDLDLRVAHVYKDLGEISKAREMYNYIYNKLSVIDRLSSEEYQLVRVAKMSLAELHSMEGNLELATQTMKFVIDQEVLHAKETNRKPVLRSNYCRLASYERLQGDYESSYHHFKEGLIYFEDIASGVMNKRFASQKYLKRFYPHFAQVCKALDKNEEYEALMEYLFSVTKPIEKEYLRLLNVKVNVLFMRREWVKILNLQDNIKDFTVFTKQDKLDFLFYKCSSLYELKRFGELEENLKLYEDTFIEYDDISGENHWRYDLLMAKLLFAQNDADFNDHIEDSLNGIYSSLYSTGSIWDSKLALKHIKALAVLLLEKDLTSKVISKEEQKEHFLLCFNQILQIERSYALAKKDPGAGAIGVALRKIYSKQSLIENKKYEKIDVYEELELDSELFKLREKKIILLDSLSDFISNDVGSGIIDKHHYKKVDEGIARLFLVYHDSTLYRLFEYKEDFITDTIALASNELRLITNGLFKNISANASFDANYADLYDLLFKNIDLSDDISTLEIYADDVLVLLPFDLLIKEGKRLIELFPIVYHPTSIEKSYDNQSVLVAPFFDQSSINRLLFNTEEVKAIKEHVSDAQIIYRVIKVDDLMPLLEQSKIIHFATHSILNVDNPDYSYILLGDSEDPIRLFQKDIGRWDVSSEMVCLTSCDSGIGEVIEGDGMYSLARNFMASGAKSVISTLWSINDQSSSFIIKEFYKELKKGKRKDEALRQAKLTYLAQADPEYQHPYYWAAFVAMGDMSPLFDPYKKWKIGGSVLAILLLGGVGYRKYSALKAAA